MAYTILDSGGKEVATASDACEARDKVKRGGCVFGNQTIRDQSGATISEEQLEALCAQEEAAEANSPS